MKIIWYWRFSTLWIKAIATLMIYNKIKLLDCTIMSKFTYIWSSWNNNDDIFSDEKYDYPTRSQVILKCNINDSAFVISQVRHINHHHHFHHPGFFRHPTTFYSQVYNMLLITVCTIYAVKTRKVPENFNEAKFIGEYKLDEQNDMCGRNSI